MNIIALKVNGLFGSFDHDLRFPSGERLMIMIGPNGYGKTMTLRIIDALFNHPATRLARLPFRKVSVAFDNNTTLVVERSPKTRVSAQHLPLKMSLLEGKKTSSTFTPTKPRIDTRSLDFPLAALDDIIPILERVGSRQWRNMQTEEVLSLEDVLVTFENELPGLDQGAASPLPDWLKEIKAAIPVRLIGTERLTKESGTDADRSRYGRHPGSLRWNRSSLMKRTVRVYSEELADLVNQAMTAYGTLSQSLDRTFPARVVADSNTSRDSMEVLRCNLDKIESRRQELEEVGLLAGEEESHFAVPSLESVDDSRHAVLRVYANDAGQKLRLFDDLYDKVSSFRRIANSRLLYKQVAPGKGGLLVMSRNNESLDLEMLSSGEQHELVIIYELLFRTQRNALILIDEPELSLHVAWQAKFLDDLQEMAQLSSFMAILATHSPEIIGDRWDLTVELKDPQDDARA